MSLHREPSTIRRWSGLLALAGLGAVLLAPAFAFADSAATTAPPSQYRGPGNEVPSAAAPVTRPDLPPTRTTNRDPDAWSRWEFWFEHNKDVLLREVLARRDAGPATGLLLVDGDRPAHAPVDAAMIDERILPALRAALLDRNRDVRTAAMLALGNAQDRNSVAPLVRILRRGDDVERATAALALGFLGDATALPPLGDALDGDATIDVRSHAALAMGLIGNVSAAPALREALERSFANTSRAYRELRPAVLHALGLLRDRASVPALHRLVTLKTVKDDRARAHAVAALGAIGHEDSGPVLLGLLGDGEDPLVRRAATTALASYAGDKVVAALQHVLTDDADDLARGRAAIALARIAGAGATKELIAHTAIRHPDSVRGFALIALGLGGDRHAAPTLRRFLVEDRDASLRGAAAIALGLLGDRAAVPVLRGLVAEDSTPGALAGHALLADAMIDDPLAGTRSMERLADLDLPAELRRNAALAAGLRSRPETGAALVRALLHQREPAVRGAALLGLGLAPERGVVPLLVDITTDRGIEAAPWRVQSVTALGQMARRGALPPVARLASSLDYRALTPSLDAALRVF